MSTQLFLDFESPAQTVVEPTTPAENAPQIPIPAPPQRPQLNPGIDAILKALLNRSNYSTDLEHLGVFHRNALPEGQLLELMSTLRTRIHSRVDFGDALLTATGLLVGLPPALAQHIPLCGSYENAPPAIRIDTLIGCCHLDYEQTLLEGGAAAPWNDISLPATHLFTKPLPRDVARPLRELHEQRPQAQTLGELCSAGQFCKAQPLDGKRFGRLRVTAARALNGIAALSLRLGIDRYHASLCATAPELCGRSRLFYVRSDNARLSADLNLLYRTLGFDDAEPCFIQLPFGSRVVPGDDHVQWCHEYLVLAKEASRPKRRYTLKTLIEHHNRCVVLWGHHLSFVLGLRPMKALDFCATRCQPRIRMMEVADKLSGEFKRMQPVLLGSFAQAQVALVWSHLHELARRAQTLGLQRSTPWMSHLQNVLRKRNAHLLFGIHGENAVPLGTAAFQSALPAERRMAANSGRHYWQTFFYNQGFSTSDIDRWARHSPPGRQTNSGRDWSALDGVARRLTTAQDDKLRQLGIKPAAGLCKRVAHHE